MGLTIHWQVAKHKHPEGLWLRVIWETDFWKTANLPNKLDELLFEITQWCKENDCGVRMSYDLFRFEDRAQVTMFLLRWAK